MATTKAHLENLPEELVLLIINHLDLNNLQTLRALNQTSQRLHRLNSQYLYHSFPGRNSELFLRTISEHPKLATYIKSAIWHQERKTNPVLHVIEKTHIVRKLHQLAVPQQGTDLAEQFAKFGKNDDYWYMEVLLLFMPNLEALTIRDSWLWDDHHYWFKSLSSFFNPLYASKLTSATLFGPLRIENVVPLLTIPSLRTLELTQVVVMRREGYRVFQWAVWPVDRLLPAVEPGERGAREGCVSNLETLVLRESYIDLEYLLPVLRGIKGLKSFTYEHTPNDLADSAHGDHVNKNAIAQICRIHRKSLTYLRIRDTQIWTWPRCISDAIPSDTNALRTLDIGPFSPVLEKLFGPIADCCAQFVRALPPNLSVLRLGIDSDILAWGDVERGFYESKIIEFLEKLAPVIARNGRSGLREVVVCDWPLTLGWFPDDMPALQKLWMGLGLKLTSI